MLKWLFASSAISRSDNVLSVVFYAVGSPGLRSVEALTKNRCSSTLGVPDEDRNIERIRT